MNTQLRWDDLQLFLAVGEEGSLSAAARRFKLGQSTLSRRIQALEDQVGETLINRVSKGSPLTLAGQRLLPAAQRMAEWAAEAEASLKLEQNQHVRGKVRIAAPPAIATELVLSWALQLRRSHPALQLQILAGVETLNLNRSEADLSLRTSRPTDPDLEVLNAITSCVRVYASAQYLSRLPANPRADQLDWIAWAPPYEHLSLNAELQARIPGFQPVLSSDDFLVLLAACRQGVGVLPLASAMLKRQTIGELVPITGLALPQIEAELFLVAHKRHRQLSKLQPVIDLINAEFESIRANA
jgi:DNA-binding transcriptional LysR family regulator